MSERIEKLSKRPNQTRFRYTGLFHLRESIVIGKPFTQETFATKSLRVARKHLSLTSGKVTIGLNHKTIIHVIIFMNAILAIIDTLFIVVKVEESNRKLGLRSSQLSVQLQEATSMHNAKVMSYDDDYEDDDDN